MAFNLRGIFKALADADADVEPLDMDDIQALREIAAETGQQAQ